MPRKGRFRVYNYLLVTMCVAAGIAGGLVIVKRRRRKAIRLDNPSANDPKATLAAAT